MNALDVFVMSYVLVMFVLTFLSMRYHRPLFFEFFDPATRGYAPLQDGEKVLLIENRSRIQPNNRPLWRSRYLNLVLTNRRLCVSYFFAAKGYWLFTLPVTSITGAYVNFDHDAMLESFVLKLDTDCSTRLQTLMIRFATPDHLNRWTNALQNFGVKIRGDITP